MNSDSKTAPDLGLFQKIHQWIMSRSKKQKILLGVGVSLLIIALAIVGYVIAHPSNEPMPTRVFKAIKQEPPKPIVYRSELTGLVVDKAISEHPVTAVMIENSRAARPQSGLMQAGVVFEAVAEGGITRYLTLFQDQTPDYVGPVRSVRPYYIQWAKGFDAPIAHVGGSGEALAMIRGAGGKDLDQFFNPNQYWRVSSRPAPHNMYSDIQKLRELQTSKGWGTSNFKGFVHSQKESPAAQVTARTIDFNISSPIYNPHYDYDPTTNTYLRALGGEVHKDDKSGQQLAPKVVIGLVVSQGANGIYTTYKTIGSGHVYIFQNGIVEEGTWEKTAEDAQITFKKADGKTIELNPGQTWVSVIGGTDRVSFKP